MNRKEINNERLLLSNLSFDHPLTSLELENLVHTLSAPILLGQVYFKGTIDMESIEKIKLLLEGLLTVEDRNIEKYIMKSISDKEKEKIGSMSFLNIDTWNIAYSIESNKYSITSLAKYRCMNEWFTTLIKEMDEGLSPFEKVCYLYDRVKLLEYTTNSRYDRLPEIIKEGKATSYGYNLIFKELLSLSGLDALIEKYSLEGEEGFLTITRVEDEKYNASGIYFFDPSMDTILKDQYKNPMARRMNYNWFALTASRLRTSSINPSYGLKVLLSKDIDEYRYYLDSYQKKCLSKNEKILGSEIDELHSQIVNTKEIEEESLFDIFDLRIASYINKQSDRAAWQEMIVKNYKARDREFFGIIEGRQKVKREIA